MFAKILAFLLLASPLMADVRITLRDSTLTNSLGLIHDTFLKAGDDSIKNKSTNGTAELDKNTRVLFRTGNLREILGDNRIITSCSLAFTTQENLVDPNKGGRLALHEMLVDWEYRTSPQYRTGALWRYASAPMYPDTVAQSELPLYFSWNDSSLDTKAKDQLGCGSCYAHAAASGFEAAAKIQGSIRNFSYNSGNGTDVDRTVSPYDTMVVEVGGSGASWVVFNISPDDLMEMYNDPDKECGWLLLWIEGQFTINTTENANTSYRPKVFVNYVVDSLGSWELSKSITGTTNISDVGLFKNSDSTTAKGADTSFTFASTSTSYLFKINGIQDLFGDSVSQFASAFCSVYVKVGTDEGYAKLVKPLKKWVENEATGTLWKTSNRWSLLSAGQTDEIDASEQQLLNCGGMTCSGGTPGVAFEYWRRNGVYSEEQYPYKNDDGIACTDTTGKSLPTRLTWWWYAKHSTIEEIKQQVLVRPMTATIELYSNFSGYTSGCFVGDNLSLANGHAISVIGWNDTMTCGGTTGAWHIKNSWGEDWGDEGRGWLAYDTNACLLLGPTYSAQYVIPETVEQPVMWSTAGMASGVDYNATAMATVDITDGVDDEYKVAIPLSVVNEWYTDTSSNLGLVIKPYFDLGLPPPDTAATYIGLSGSDSYNPYFIVTYESQIRLGNVRLGRNPADTSKAIKIGR